MNSYAQLSTFFDCFYNMSYDIEVFGSFKGR